MTAIAMPRMSALDRLAGLAPAAAAASAPPRGLWLDWLAAWAEHQPVHRRMGAWTQVWAAQGRSPSR
jgi:hypothetical protein